MRLMFVWILALVTLPAMAEDELTLERLFPDRSIFGPSASQTGFSFDGRYGSFLYRPREESRHGNDLWIHDTQTGRVMRMTSVSKMSPFQDSSRSVRDDRIRKWKQKYGSKKDDTKKEPDALSGDWEGRLSGEEGSSLPPPGVTISLSMRLAKDGSVSGQFTSALSRADISKGRFDGEVFECELSDDESGLTATLRATIANDVLRGTIRTEDFELRIEAERTGLDEGVKSTGVSNSGMMSLTEDEIADRVLEEDAEDRRAPRYRGISTYTWSPRTHELIFTSENDLYRLNVNSGEITRLTLTRERERNVQYLPDASGFTYQQSDVIMRVSFDSHLTVQLDPDLPSNESMSGYELSPDGKRLVILAGRGQSYWASGRQVSIVNYRSRFAEVRQYSRHMPDDPFPDYFYSVYIYDIGTPSAERRTLKKVHEHKQSGPRDTMQVPTFSPDSNKVAFASYAQDTGHVNIYESVISTRKEKGEVRTDIEDARVIYRFLHYGGPNTPGMVQPRYLADSRHLVFITELSGFRQLHVLDPVYEQLEQLTSGQFEVYPIGMSRDRARMFAYTTRGDPAQQHVEMIALDSGEITRLSKLEGVYSNAAVSDDGSNVLATRIDFGYPRELVAIGKETRALTDSHREETHELTKFEPEYFSFENRNGQTIHGHMFKPDDWKASDERPLLIYVYGGPLGTRKMVTRGAFSGDSYYFAYYMAKKHGYVTCTVDPRGASGYGAFFEKSNFEQVGRPQVEDLVDAARWMVKNSGVDEKRMALHGWSFGGFQTQMTLYTEPDVFAAGIAGAGPTEWENYNSWYSTGTIGDNRPGRTDLSKFSLLPLAKNLKARLLLIHGMEDSNVLYQDTVRVYRELLQAGKETLVELFLDPTGGHGLGGDVKTRNRFRKYESFLLRTLGSGNPEDEAKGEKGANAPRGRRRGS